MQLTTMWLVPGFFFLIVTAEATEPTPVATPAQLKSADWWREQAVRYADQIADDEARGQTHYELVYVRARTGDLDGASVSARNVKNSQLRVYAHCFLAKQYKKKGNEKACRSELQQARQVAPESQNISVHAGVIRPYLELGYPADALSLAAEIADQQQQRWAYQQIAEILAEQGKLGEAQAVVEQHLPPIWHESAVSMMASACASKMHVDDTQKLVAQLTAEKDRDKAYTNLTDALVRAGHDADAGLFADRISDPARKAAALARIAAQSAKNQSLGTIQVRIAKAAGREEKLALYDVLFAKLVEAGNLAGAEAVIESMVKTIQASPRQAVSSKFGTSDDASAIAVTRSKYLTIALLLAKKGDRKGSLVRLAKARDAITGLPPRAGITKMLLHGALVGAQITVGDLDGARRTLGQLQPAFSRSQAAAHLAVALIASGNVKSGLEVAELVTDPVGRGRARGAVTSALVRAGDLPAAKAMLQKIGDGKDDVEAFRAASQAMVQTGRARELHAWLSDITSNTARAYLCMGVAEPLRKQ
jgi:lipopolysaccharide biosynthesis regulator YciM